MKRIVSAVGLILLCTGICIYGSLATEKKTEALVNLLNQAEYYISTDSDENLLQVLGILEEEWESAAKFFSTLSETALIDEIGISLGSIKKYIQSGMKQEAVITIEECRHGLRAIMRKQKISPENVL